MLQNAGKFRSQRVQAADRNAQLAVIDRSGPGGGVGDVEESLLGVERDQNIVAGRIAEIANQVVVVRFERLQDLSAKGFGRLFAFIMQSEMSAFARGEVGLNRLLALGLGQKLLHRRVGAQFEGTLPGGDGLLGVIGGELRVAEHGVGVR